VAVADLRNCVLPDASTTRVAKRRSRRRSPALLLAAAVVIAGCGSSSKAATTTSTTTPVTVTSTTTSAPTTSASSTTAAANAARGLTGIVSTVGGSGATDGSGIPGLASAASLGAKPQFAIASNGDIFVSTDSLNVLKISGGQISVYGTIDPGTGPGSGGIAVGPGGSVFVATSSTVRKFTTDGKSTVVLTAAAAGLSSSLGPITVDTDGNLYVADGSRRITRVGTDGKMTVIAGTGVQAPPDTAAGDSGPATKSALGAPSQLLVDTAGNLFFTDASAHRVRRVATDGTISTVAGGGTVTLAAGTELYAPDGTKATSLKLSEVSGIAIDGKGRIYVADALNHAIFRFGADGSTELVAGDQKGGSQAAGLPANQTRVTNVRSLGVDNQGNLLYLEGAVLHAIKGAGS
jgi:hypothetical protein